MALQEERSKLLAPKSSQNNLLSLNLKHIDSYRSGLIGSGGVLVWVSIALKRNHDHSNSYKRKHLIGGGLQFKRFILLILWQDVLLRKQIWCRRRN